jgi:hypothetical protein
VGRVYDEIDDRLGRWITAQPVFFVATAPLDQSGHINLSPKGGPDQFTVLGPRQVAYLDLTGSGIETVAHLRENGRITLMFCAFDGPPRIVRLQGTGEAVLAGTDGFDALSVRFPPKLGARAVIRVDVERIADSCGYSVPLMDFVGHRDNLDHWAERKGDEGIREYWAERNALSIDGLKGLP